ncbi:MAG: PEP-CTERM sorting domain-containing protein [Planctomycetaceae bacterium]
MNRCFLLNLIPLLCMATTSAQGDIIVDVRDATMSAGSSSFVDVWLTGDPGDTLEAFGYQFAITGATPQSGDLQFSVVQSNSEVTESGPPPYVFLGHSDGFNSSRTDPVSLAGGDVLEAGQQDSPVGGTFLLARLELEHVGSMTDPTHQFTISLVDANSVFDKDADNPGVSLLGFTSFSGTVTVTSAAVPEPSTALALGIMTAAGGWVRRIKRRKSANFKSEVSL